MKLQLNSDVLKKSYLLFQMLRHGYIHERKTCCGNVLVSMVTTKDSSEYRMKIKCCGNMQAKDACPDYPLPLEVKSPTAATFPLCQQAQKI